METFLENIKRNAVATASANNEDNNIYSLALNAYNELPHAQQLAFEIAYKAYQRKWALSISYQTQKSVSKETKQSGVAFVMKYAKVVTHFEQYETQVKKENSEFNVHERAYGVRINPVCVYYKGQLYLSVLPHYTDKARYFLPNGTEITYSEEQSMLCPSARDEYKKQKTAQTQGLATDDIIKYFDIKIQNIGSIKCGATEQINEIELELI